MTKRRTTGNESGFIITLEMVLIFTILGIGLFVGIAAIRNALFVHAMKKRAQTVYVYDSSDPAKILGPVRDFDEHEAPRLFFTDRNVDWNGATNNFRAFIGVRDDRFTSRHRVFYTGSSDCGATGFDDACIARSGDELGDDKAVGTVQVQVVDSLGGTDLSGAAKISQGGGIGYLYPLQGGPSYGIGREIDASVFRTANPGLPGTLYRETEDPCDATQVGSVWTSQSVVSGGSCEPLPAGATVDAKKCPDGRNGANVGDPCLPPADPECITTNPGSGLVCSCPAGWQDYGSNCCPPGTVEATPGQCTLGSNNALAIAVPVQLFGANALSSLEPPFHVNLPPDPNSFELLAPGGAEGAPGTPTNIPYDPSGPMDFNAPADGIEGAPPGL